MKSQSLPKELCLPPLEWSYSSSDHDTKTTTTKKNHHNLLFKWSCNVRGRSIKSDIQPSTKFFFYMAERRYKTTLWLLKNISPASAMYKWNIFQQETKNLTSPSSHAIFFLLYKNQWNTQPFYFCFKRDNMLLSHDTLSCKLGISLLSIHWIIAGTKVPISQSIS